MRPKPLITQTIFVVFIAGLLAGLWFNALPPAPAYAAAGDLDPTFNPGTGANNTVFVIAVQSDGKILIGGLLTTYNDVGRNRIARLNPDGSLDATFDPGVGADERVFAIAVQGDGKILIGGMFTTYQGTARSGIARLNADGALDTSFDPSTGTSGTLFSVRAIVVQSDGTILIGGSFTTCNGVARNEIARLDSTGTLDTSFNPGAGAGLNSYVFKLVVQSGGKILIGGWFSSYGGVARSGIARLNTDGSLDTSFNPGTGVSGGIAIVYGLTAQSDGTILIGGGFTSYNGTGRTNIARLNADGSLDTSFDPGTGTTSRVNDILVQNDGKVLLGGDFTSYNSTGRNRIARLGTPIIALSSPAVNAANVYPATTNLVLYRLNIAPTVFGATLTGLTVTPGGSYQPADFVANSFKLHASPDATLDASDPTVSTQAIVASGSPLAFTGLSQVIGAASTGYLFVTVDMRLSATAGRTITIAAPALTAITFASGDKSGTLSAGGAQTIVSASATYADPDGTCAGHVPCYPSLQTAIFCVDAGGPVVAYGGTYNEGVTLNRDVSVTLIENAALTGNLTLALGTFNLGANTLALGGDFNSLATLNAGAGTVTFTGSALQTIGGTGTLTFNHLTIANPSGLNPAVKLKTDAVVNGTLTLQSGALGVYAETFTLNGPVNTSGGSMARMLPTTTYAQAAPGQYGHLAFNHQPKTLANDGVVSIAGDFDPGAAMTHTVTGSTVAFNGSGVQTITQNAVLNDVRVSSGVTLTTAANVTVGGTLTNDGWTKETRTVAGLGARTFGLAKVVVDVTTQGSLSSLEVIRRDQDHPNATVPLQTGMWWKMTPTGASYTANLTLPVRFIPDANSNVCRYSGTGLTWDCAQTGFDAAAKTISRSGITAFSAWTTGNNAPPPPPTATPTPTPTATLTLTPTATPTATPTTEPAPATTGLRLLNGTIGAPGSQFAIVAEGFTPGHTLAITVNGVQQGRLTVRTTGQVAFGLWFAASAAPGSYTVQVTEEVAGAALQATSAEVVLLLDPTAPRLTIPNPSPDTVVIRMWFTSYVPMVRR